MTAKIRKRIENNLLSIIYEKEEDAKTQKGLKTLLLGFSRLYGAIVRARTRQLMRQQGKSCDLPAMIISVGNLTMGGTGKTPMTLYLAKLIRALDLPSAIISRGYKGTKQKIGGVVSNGKELLLNSNEAGDEPVMMAKSLKDIPVLINQNRTRAVRFAIKTFGAKALILDDGYQHLKVKRDLNLLLLDHKKPFGNGHLIPRGSLREELFAIRRADAIVFTRCQNKGGLHPGQMNALPPGIPLFYAHSEPYIHRVVDKYGEIEYEDHKSRCGARCAAALLENKRVVVFSGIGQNDDFLKTVQGFKCHVSAFMPFADHHPYCSEDVENIIKEARKCQAELILTTEKDDMRLSHVKSWGFPLVVMGIHMTFGDDRFDQFIKAQMGSFFSNKSSTTGGC